MDIDTLLSEIELDPENQDEILALSSIFESDFKITREGQSITGGLEITYSGFKIIFQFLKEISKNL